MDSTAARELWIEAILLALQDIDNQSKYSKEYKNKLVVYNRTSAIRWLKSRDFATICDCLGYDAKQIRKAAFR